ncbi:MAG TPA: beta-L-arabinofuranosidase domain-containing protein [Galbitalea sp.]
MWPTRGTLRPLGPDEIKIVDGFWHDKQQLNSEVILAHCQSWMERIGWVGNFDRAADGTIGASHAGIEFVDSEIYKLLEAMAWELARATNPALQERYRALVERVAAAQEPDGYLHTSFGRAGQQPRYSNLEWGHELYCFGHLIQAAVARLRSGLDDELPAIARRLADHLYVEFGPLGRSAVCGHPEIEVALAEFARATGEPRYLELASLFIERRGTGTLGPIAYGAEYFQDDEPIREASVLRGHAVRALYLSAGAVDVGVETADHSLVDAVRTQWSNTVARRTYVTGGMGSHHLDEAFGLDYELPSDRAYSETCAGIASVMLSWRLLLETGETKYADLIERTLLNNILASPREDGRAFFYTNTLHQRVNGTVPPEDGVSSRAESSLRAPWFEVSCCPTNVARTLASVNLYFATATDAGVQLHQFGDYDVNTEIARGAVSLRIRSGYPFDGAITVSVLEAPPGGADLSVRIPEWAVGAQLDGELVAPGTSVTRSVQTGAEVLLSLPMDPRIIHPHPSIDAVRGTVAVERGPLVLALESTDLPRGASVATARLLMEEALTLTPNGASSRIRTEVVAASEWPYSTTNASSEHVEVTANLVPYFSWANRGPSTMRVWIPTV